MRDIQGMSGGPIIGVNRSGDGSGQYWVIAVQSGWYPRERVVCATTLASVRDPLLKVITAILHLVADQVPPGPGA